MEKKTMAAAKKHKGSGISSFGSVLLMQKRVARRSTVTESHVILFLGSLDQQFQKDVGHNLAAMGYFGCYSSCDIHASMYCFATLMYTSNDDTEHTIWVC